MAWISQLAKREAILRFLNQNRVVICGLLVCHLLVIVSFATPVWADEAADLTLFESQIRPVLIKHCYECHSQDSEEVQGGLLLDSASGWQRGGDSGPAIVPGEAEDSLLIQAIRYDGLEMPPSGKLPTSTIRHFQQWIARGAVDPRQDDPGAAPRRSTVDLEAGKQFWAFQPLSPSAPPTAFQQASWVENEIDAYVLAALNRHQMLPAPDADPTTLVRRLYFDLTGLPPSPREVDHFLADNSPHKLRQLVDRLLESPSFGEHWGRHWLDVARYADSNGGDFNATFHDAWRYRDYVVAAFNHDKPFDEFVRQQIAGDLLAYDSNAARAENLIATGFLMLGAKMLSERDKEKMTMDVVDEQINVVGQAFMGLTLGCARCHDHKFDPIPTTDYYALAGAFLSTESLKGESQKYVSTWPRRRLPVAGERVEAVEAYQAKRKQLTQRIKALKKRRDQLKKGQQPQQDKKKGSGPRDGSAAVSSDTSGDQKLHLQDVVATLKQRERELTELDDRAPDPLPTAMAVVDAPQIGDCQLCVRGDHQNRGQVVPRGLIQVISPQEPQVFSQDTSGRLEIANWIASPHNPLTARVMANRIWQHLIGEGLVRTVDNFGALGDRPSHPRLLDRLAAEFISHGWSIKYLVRKIVLSRTYRMSTRHVGQYWKQDPDNRWLWSAHRKRLPAESIRDAMLAVSGRLDRREAGTPVAGLGTLVTQNNANQTDFVAAESRHRSLYLPMIRGELNSMLAAFDLADPDRVVGRRAETNVPAQTLLLLNSDFVIQCARATAELILEQSDQSQNQVMAAYRRVLGRPPTDQELARAVRFLEQSRGDSDGTDRVGRQRDALSQLVHVQFASTEFRMLD